MIRLAILAFALGCAWLQTRAALPPLAWAALLPLGALIVAWLPGQGWGRWPRRLGWLTLALAAGFLYAAWRADARLGEALPGHWAGRDVSFTGRVAGLPETTPNGLRFLVDVGAVTTPGASLPGRVQLSWFARRGEALPPIDAGACLALGARLYPPHGSANPGGFDYEAWLLERGIRATGSLTAPPTAAEGCGRGLGAEVDRTRDRIRGQLLTTLGDARYAGIVVALAVGDQAAIPAPQWTLFRTTGTSHLFSVSGLHITLFSALVYGLVRLFWRRAPGLNLRLPAHRAGIALGLLAAAGYTLLAGFAIPAQRTLFMLTGAAAVAWLDRTPTPSRLLAAALLAVVLLDPWAALAPGFWLSFGAVAALLYAGMGRLRPAPAWRAWLQAQWAVTLALTPLLLALFHEVSLVSPLANAVAIPAVSLVAVPLSLLAAALAPLPGLGEVLAWAAHGVIAVVMWVLAWLARLPQPVLHAAQPGIAALALALLGAGVLLLPRGLPARWLGLVLCLPLFLPRLPAPAPGEAWLTVLDVGQGEAVLLRTRAHTLLVDAGPRFASGEDSGGRVVAPYLWSQGIARLDGLVLTHDDLDHSGGVASALASHRPRWVLSALAGMDPQQVSETGRAILARRRDALACSAGQAWTWDGVVFRVLHPPSHQYAQAGYADNDRGCVIRVETAHGSALLAADIERLGEMNLAERGVLQSAEVLVVPHHGSKTSSTTDFLAVVRPRLAVIPVGERNRYGHPHPEVMARYRGLGVPILRTDRDGAVTVRFTGGGFQVERQRRVERRYWRDRE